MRINCQDSMAGAVPHRPEGIEVVYFADGAADSSRTGSFQVNSGATKGKEECFFRMALLTSQWSSQVETGKVAVASTKPIVLAKLTSQLGNTL